MTVCCDRSQAASQTSTGIIPCEAQSGEIWCSRGKDPRRVSGNRNLRFTHPLLAKNPDFVPSWGSGILRKSPFFAHVLRPKSNYVFSLYDNEGNQIQRTKIADNTVTEYEWDYRNRLVEVREETSGGVTTSIVTFQYDAFDRRTGKQVDADVNGTIDRSEAWVWDGDQVIMQLVDADGDGAGTWKLTNRYLYGDIVDMALADEQLPSGGIGLTTVSGTSGTVLWPLADHLGSVRDLVDSNGVIREHVVYDSFGNRLSEHDFDASGNAIASGNPAAVDHLFGYTGREWDDDVDLQYNRARWYDPAQGRWISKDPIGFAAGDVNQFRYVGNGPTNATDPSGLERMGHHWIPQEIFKNLKSVSRKAYYVFDKARMDPSIYNHRLDPWNGQGHRAFSRAVASVIQSYRTVYGRVISEEDATTIVKWVRDGCTNEQFLKKNAQAFETIAQWREGFLRSIVVARAAQTLDGNLTPDQLKAIAQKHINGENTPGMVKHFTPKAQAVSRKLGTRAGRALISQAAKKIIPVVAAGSTICVAKQGFAGEGPGNYEGGGVTGAIDSVLADFMWKEALDPVLRSGGQAWSDWWANLFGLDGESKKQRQIREQIRRQ
jgi:RHS repeat-associated protein